VKPSSYKRGAVVVAAASVVVAAASVVVAAASVMGVAATAAVAPELPVPPARP
jgi:hypothetical protein